MKLKKIVLAGTFSAISALAMSQARETTLTLGKDKINAVKLEVNAPVKQVQAALQQQLTTAGVKGKKAPANGFAYNDVVIPAISSDTIDVWTRVQKNGNNSIIYMAVKDQQGNYMTGSDAGMSGGSGTRSTSDSSSTTIAGTSAGGVEKLKDFLYDFARAQNYSSRDMEIGYLMDSVQTDQSGFDKYTSDRSRIESQIKELTNQLQTIEKGHSSERQDMDRRKQRLDELRNSSETGDMNKGTTETSPKKKAKNSSIGNEGAKNENRPNGGNQ